MSEPKGFSEQTPETVRGRIPADLRPGDPVRGLCASTSHRGGKLADCYGTMVHGTYAGETATRSLIFVGARGHLVVDLERDDEG